MKTELIKFFNLVKEKFIYEQGRYPVLAHLNSEEIKIFLVKNSLLKLQVGMYDFLHIDDHSWRSIYPMLTAQILVNLTKLSLSLGLSAEEFGINLLTEQSWSNEMFVNQMGVIAVDCETADRENKFNFSNNSKQAVMGMLNLFYSKTGFETLDNRPCSLLQIIANAENMVKT